VSGVDQRAAPSRRHGTINIGGRPQLALCRSLLNAGLADRFRVVIFPVITGANGYPDVALDMISSRTFDGRIQLVEYVPKLKNESL
jgi:hypothetical protein